MDVALLLDNVGIVAASRFVCSLLALDWHLHTCARLYSSQPMIPLVVFAFGSHKHTCTARESLVNMNIAEFVVQTALVRAACRVESTCTGALRGKKILSMSLPSLVDRHKVLLPQAALACMQFRLLSVCRFATVFSCSCFPSV